MVDEFTESVQKLYYIPYYYHHHHCTTAPHIYLALSFSWKFFTCCLLRRRSWRWFCKINRVRIWRWWWLATEESWWRYYDEVSSMISCFIISISAVCAVSNRAWLFSASDAICVCFIKPPQPIKQWLKWW